MLNLKDISARIADLGIGNDGDDERPVNGADAVDFLAALREDINDVLSRVTVALSHREVCTVVAGLRFLQSQDETPTPPNVLDVLTDGGNIVAMSDDEIDALCERINFGD